MATSGLVQNYVLRAMGACFFQSSNRVIKHGPDELFPIQTKSRSQFLALGWLAFE